MSLITTTLQNYNDDHYIKSNISLVSTVTFGTKVEVCFNKNKYSVVNIFPNFFIHGC